MYCEQHALHQGGAAHALLTADVNTLALSCQLQLNMVQCVQQDAESQGQRGSTNWILT